MGWPFGDSRSSLGAAGDTGFSTTVGRYRIVTEQDWNNIYVTRARPLYAYDEYPLAEEKAIKLSKARENHRNMVIRFLRMSR